MVEEVDNQEDWRVGFAFVTEGATNQEDWRGRREHGTNPFLMPLVIAKIVA
jgi:hypothetical protein